VALVRTPWKVRGYSAGVNLEFFYIRSIDEGDFYVKFLLRNKKDGF